MSLEEDIHQMVLSMDGVATVYAADPVWLSALKQLGSLMDPDSAAQPVPFVVCSEAASSETDTGDTGGTGDAGSTGGSSCRSVMTVKIRIGTDGALRAPDMARSVAGAIRTFVTALHPDVQVKAVVEISAIGV